MSLFKIIFRRRKVRVGGIRKNKTQYLKLKEQARELVNERIKYWLTLNGRGVDTIPLNRINRVSIKNTKSRWGSCSKKGNLNFNYKIALLPPALADYLVVHELCHLKEFNHSEKFWKLVLDIMPDYKKLKRELKSIRILN